MTAQRTEAARDVPHVPEVPETVQRTLIGFQRSVGEVIGCAVADGTGRAVATTFPRSVPVAEVVSLMSLAAGSATAAFRALGLRGPEAGVLFGTDATLLIQGLESSPAAFLCLVRKGANVGLVELAMRATARRLDRELLNLTPEGRVEEVLLLTRGGLLVGHGSQRALVTRDHDLVAGMVTAVQAFVKDSFDGLAGPLEELELANLRVRLVRGRHVILAILATGPAGAAFLEEVRSALEAFEQRNGKQLDPWNGDPSSLEGVDRLVETVLGLRLE